MTTLELYVKGARVWIRHTEKVWEGAELLEDYTKDKKKLQVLSESQAKIILDVKEEKDLPPLRNPSIFIGQNDLTALSYLHEPAVLHNLNVRFCQQRAIYTYCGIVLVAINPYDELPIYDTDTIRTYRGQAMGDLDPHIFAVAEEAYTKLEQEQRDQSIIVSGESGAGKTISAKYAMRYFASVGGSDTETQVEKKVLASSPIMEAIGNAKTTRNDNSSRFGKYIEIQFNKNFRIIGASMRTYLLEKSRVVFQAADERNYHIFYQLCASRKLFPDLCLDDSSKFHYLNQGESPPISGVDDSDVFRETVEALNTLGFTESEQSDMFKILAAILHLGNVKFKECLVKMENEQTQEGCGIKEIERHLEKIAALIQVDPKDLQKWLCTRKIVSMRDIILIPMTVREAMSARDALAKHIYSELFNWIVFVINKALESGETRHKFIGVLDIYGFETFEKNSFEQFCINYANEKLQQQFNQHVFKLEQEEYIREGIEWTMIDFYDNQPCIDLIESKLGILDLLDEECRVPQGSDQSWAQKLYTKCSKSAHFAKPRFGTDAFVVKHFADSVEYDSQGFLDKNRDTVMEEQIAVVRSSHNQLVRMLFSEKKQLLAVPGVKIKVLPTRQQQQTQQQPKAHKKTVGSQFRDSLHLLMATLNATTPHYVRCIKPNDSKSAFEYNPQRVVQQLRACGVLETIRISAAGFPSLWTYFDFFQRYRVLGRSNDIDRNDFKQTCRTILSKTIRSENCCEFGKTKIFFRAGQVAYLEKLRAEMLERCCIRVQSQVRMFVQCKKYCRLRRGTITIQAHIRGLLARRRAEEIRRTRAAIVIQKNVRRWLQSLRYRRIKTSVLLIQTYGRGFLARQRFMQLKYNAKAIVIQRHVRGWLARKRMAGHKRKIIVCQSAVRRFLAKKEYRRLKVEARSVEHVKNLNKGLENKIISLQQKIEELNKDSLALKNAQAEIIELRNKIEHMRNLEAEIRKLNSLLNERNQYVAKIEEHLKRELDEKMDLVEDQEKYRRTVEDERKHWSEETQKLRKELENLNEIVRSSQRGAEENLRSRLELEKQMMLDEQDFNIANYQKLLQDYNNLEQHCENVEKQLRRQNQDKHGWNNLSDVSSLSMADDAMTVSEDFGYGSVRQANSSTPSHAHVESINWKGEERGDGKAESPQGELGLTVRLQKKLLQLERENSRLQHRIDELDASPTSERAANHARDSLKISELEIQNSDLRAKLSALRESVATSSESKQLLEQFHSQELELERLREECIQLRSVLANRTSTSALMSHKYAPDPRGINEDGELSLAYDTQKKINKQLELELQDEKAKYKAYEKELRAEIEALKKDNDRQQVVISSNVAKPPVTQKELLLQSEIGRLVDENLKVQEKCDTIEEQRRKYKQRAKFFAKKLQQAGLLEIAPQQGAGKAEDVVAVDKYKNLSSIRKKERDYQGMFEYKSGEEPVIIRQLVNELKPRTAVTLLPGLPAYILFMCIRHTDFVNDSEKVNNLLTNFMYNVKKFTKKHQDDLEVAVLWLSNTVRLLHNLKQYSGEEVFQSANTPRQNEQSLRNFDLSEYRQHLSDIAVWIYQFIIRNLEEKIQPLVVPAILEHEAITTVSKPANMRGRATSISQELTSPDMVQKSPDSLVHELTSSFKILGFYGVDPEVVEQIFKQLFYFICASSLNNLLLRKDLCHWAKGSQIRYNISYIEMWTREKKLNEGPIHNTLQPIIEAAHLLQARKNDEDVESVCEMCSSLSSLQICKILNLYTPVDEYEQRVPASFIAKVQAKLAEKGNAKEQQSLLMDVKFSFPVRFPFNPSNIRLEDIDIPDVLNLPMLKKV